MKSYVACSLVLFQMVSIYGASQDPSMISFEDKGYTEWQSEKSSKRGDSYVLDFSFEPSNCILDWADLVEVKKQTVRAIALIKMSDSQKKLEHETTEQLKPFLNTIAVQLLRVLKQKLKKEATINCCYDVYYAQQASDEELLSKIKALALRLECANLNGSVYACYETENNLFARFDVTFGLRNWHASLQLVDSKPMAAGSSDLNIAQGGVRLAQKHADDLHMLIFHRNPALVMQDQ